MASLKCGWTLRLVLARSSPTLTERSLALSSSYESSAFIISALCYAYSKSCHWQGSLSIFAMTSRHGLDEVYTPPTTTKSIVQWVAKQFSPDFRLIRYSIIFVHGLFGHPRKTWSGEAAPSKVPRPLNVLDIFHESSNSASPDATPYHDQKVAQKNAAKGCSERSSQDVSVGKSQDRTGTTTAGSWKINTGLGKDSESLFWPAALLPNELPNARIFTWGYDADIDNLKSSASQNTVLQHALNLLSDVTDLLESKDGDLPIIFVAHSLGGIIVKDVCSLLLSVFAYFLIGVPHVRHWTSRLRLKATV